MCTAFQAQRTSPRRPPKEGVPSRGLDDFSECCSSFVLATKLDLLPIGEGKKDSFTNLPGCTGLHYANIY